MLPVMRPTYGWWWWIRLITHMCVDMTPVFKSLYMLTCSETMGIHISSTMFIREVHSICQIDINFNTYNIIINNFFPVVTMMACL